MGLSWPHPSLIRDTQKLKHLSNPLSLLPSLFSLFSEECRSDRVSPGVSLQGAFFPASHGIGDDFELIQDGLERGGGSFNSRGAQIGHWQPQICANFSSSVHSKLRRSSSGKTIVAFVLGTRSTLPGTTASPPPAAAVPRAAARLGAASLQGRADELPLPGDDEEAAVVVADSRLHPLPDAAARDLDVRGDGLPSPPLPGGPRIPHVPVPRLHRAAAELVPDGLLLRGVPRSREEEGVAALLQVPRGDGDASGDRAAGDRDDKQVDAAGRLLGEAGDALLGGRGLRLPLHGARVHAMRARRHVRGYSLRVRCGLHPDSLRLMLSSG